MITVGDRIRVVATMTDDPLPPPVGAMGTVAEVVDEFVNYPNGHHKAYIKWDDGVIAVNALLLPHDDYVYEVAT